MAAPIINPLPPAPLTTDSGDVFDSKAFVFVGALDPFRVQVQAVGDWMVDTGEAIELRANSAANSEQNARRYEDGAEDARDDAVIARDAAQSAGSVYESVAAGLSGTSSGDYFSVAGANGYLTLYRNSAGSATIVANYPSQETNLALQTSLRADLQARPDPRLMALIL